MTRDLRPLFDPRSVAIVGASDDPAKWGHAVAGQALRAGTRRPVHLINRKGGRILGRAAATCVTEIGEPVDLVVICVPATAFEAAVDDALAAGAQAIVGITAGFAETGADGARRQRAVVDKVRRAGAVLVGPNCLGMVDNTTEVYLSSDTFRPGRVALLSQSGNLALELDGRLGRHGLGFSRFVSFGNQADVTLVDLLTDCAAHAGTAAIAVYAEDFGDGRAFAAAAARAGKPVVLLTAGAGEASARGARSHTGALTTSSDVIEAAARDAGIHLATTPRDVTVRLAALCGLPRARGKRIAVVTDGGGHGAVASDAAERAGLTVPQLSEDHQTRLRAALWGPSAVANPVDLAGMGEQDPRAYAATVAELLTGGEVDAVLMTGYFGGYSDPATGFAGGGLAVGELAAAGRIAVAAAEEGKPVAVQSMHPGAPSCRVLADAGIPVFGAIEDAALALATAAATGERIALAPLPPPAPPVRDTGYFAIRRLLEAAGVPFPPAREVRSDAELLDAAADLPGPYVLKALHAEHKSDSGGVVLGLRDAEALLSAYNRLVVKLGPGRFSVEQLATGRGVELIAGVRHDPRFGPVALIGIGGVQAEVWKDVVFALAPLTAHRAETLLRRLRGAPLLLGHRGGAPVDLTAAATMIARLTEVAAAQPDLAEIEVNPLLATPDGAIALDARAVTQP